MATALHKDMAGADLHPNKIDPTTTTELTPTSEAKYDARYVRTIGGTITPSANGTATLTVNRQDGTTAVLVVDTTNNRVQVGNGSTGTLKIGDGTITKSSGSIFSLGALKLTGPLGTPTNTPTSAYTIDSFASTVLADASGGAFQITLPTAASIYNGMVFTIKRINATNNVTVGTTSAQTIDGASTKTLGSQYAWITVQSNNANWFIISQGGTVS